MHLLVFLGYILSKFENRPTFSTYLPTFFFFFFFKAMAKAKLNVILIKHDYSFSPLARQPGAKTVESLKSLDTEKIKRRKPIRRPGLCKRITARCHFSCTILHLFSSLESLGLKGQLISGLKEVVKQCEQFPWK